ncbi:MAG: sugar phosphate isomerase/epimerase, partial [Roseibacillus sp.]
MNRRLFLKHSTAATGLTLVPALACADHHKKKKLLFDISLAEWSLHRTIRKGEMTNLDFPKVSKEKFGINAVEYVNQFFKDKARDKAYLTD